MDAFEPNGTDLESLLESLSLDLMENNIDMQISCQISSTTDFLSTVFSKFRYILNMDDIVDEDKMEIRFQIIDFCDELIAKIANNYELVVNEISDDYESKIELLDTLYNFFILNRYGNVERFLINYINKNKEELIEILQIDDKNKDITSISNKKKNISRENICMLSQLTEVINFIRTNQVVDAMEFINIINEGEYYTDKLIQYYDNYTLAGDFTQILLNEVLDDDYDTSELSRIRNNVRISLYE